MSDPNSKGPEHKPDDLSQAYASLVEKGDFPFGEPKNQGSSMGAFINTVKRVAADFSARDVFVRPKNVK